jgi:hypothetical protein
VSVVRGVKVQSDTIFVVCLQIYKFDMIIYDPMFSIILPSQVSNCHLHWRNHIFQAPQYLMVGGSIVFTFSALTLIALWTPCKGDDICVLCLFPLVTFIMFCINIWGAAVVFGKLIIIENCFKKDFNRSWH